MRKKSTVFISRLLTLWLLSFFYALRGKENPCAEKKEEREHKIRVLEGKQNSKPSSSYCVRSKYPNKHVGVYFSDRDPLKPRPGFRKSLGKGHTHTLLVQDGIPPFPSNVVFPNSLYLVDRPLTEEISISVWVGAGRQKRDSLAKQCSFAFWEEMYFSRGLDKTELCLRFFLSSKREMKSPKMGYVCRRTR